MQARLFCPVGEFSNLSHTFSKGVTVGRRDENDISVPSPLVSGRHAIIQWSPEANGWVVEDLKSTNGTFVAGRLVSHVEKLHHLDVLSFGGVEFLFQALDRSNDPAVKPGPEAPKPDDDRTLPDGFEATAAKPSSDAAPKTTTGPGIDPDATQLESRPPITPEIPDRGAPEKDDS